MNYQKILEEIKQEIKPLMHKGKVADYIPASYRLDYEQMCKVYGASLYCNKSIEFYKRDK